MDDHGKYISSNPEDAESNLRIFFAGLGWFGGWCNEYFFDKRSRIKQNRFNHFTEWVSDGMSDLSKVEKDRMEDEDFGDFFETVVLQVLRTKSKEKLKRFRTVLLNQITNPIKYDDAIDMAEIAGLLSDKQFLILDSFYSHSKELTFFEDAIDNLSTSKAIIKRYEQTEDDELIHLPEELKILTSIGIKVGSDRVSDKLQYLEEMFQDIEEHKSDVFDFCELLIQDIVDERDRIVKDQLRFDISPQKKIIEEEWGIQAPSNESLIGSFSSSEVYSMNDLRSKGLLFIPNRFRAQGDYNFINYRISNFGLELVKFTLKESNKTK